MMTRLNPRNGLPPAQGLYHPAHEHDACGIGFVASIPGHKSHEIIRKGIQVLLNLAHRGACGCDPETGDGAGVLIQIPHKFYARECEKLGFALPKPGTYGVGMTFLPVEKHQRLQCEGILERIVREEGLKLLGWRDTPVYASAIGRVARASQPYIQQIFVGRAPGTDEDEFERKLYVVRIGGSGERIGSPSGSDPRRGSASAPVPDPAPAAPSGPTGIIGASEFSPGKGLSFDPPGLASPGF